MSEEETPKKVNVPHMLESTERGRIYKAREDRENAYLSGNSDKLETEAPKPMPQEEMEQTVPDAPKVAPVNRGDDRNVIRVADKRIPIEFTYCPEGCGKFVVKAVAADKVEDDNAISLLLKSSDDTLIVPPILTKLMLTVDGARYNVMGVGVAHKIGNFVFIPFVKMLDDGKAGNS